MKNNSKRTFLTSMVLIGFVLAAGIWLISGNGGNRQTDAPDPFIQPMPEKTEIPAPATSPALVSRKKNQPPPVFSSEMKPEINFNYLRLIGVAMDSDRPYAIILNEKNKSQDLFRIGDLVDGAIIQDILADKVLLNYSDQIFTLGLESVLYEENDLIPIESQEHPGHVLSYMDQADIENAWEETRELMSQIELNQAMNNNEPKGVTVDKVVENSVFEKIGFRPGDVILQVDDIEISIADDAMEIYNCLRTKPTVQFTVSRNGETLILNYRTTNPPD